MTRRRRSEPARGEVLVAIMNNKTDFRILQEQGWYRIPVASAPKRWPPKWLAIYQTKVFRKEAYAVRYYGRVRAIQVVRRRELFPNEFPNPKSDRRYYQLHLDSLERLGNPIFSRRWRRIVFIPTTWQKFIQAAEINDLYDESPLEDRLWAELRRLEIRAERQWHLKVERSHYFLDFAVFCQKGKIDIETDGDTYHIQRERVQQDNRRHNHLQSAGWRVLRFNGKQIRQAMAEYCMPEITEMITTLGGLSDEGLVPRVFYQTSEGVEQQLSLFEADINYDLD
jgi:very-short-patch-repair endonuclease